MGERERETEVVVVGAGVMGRFTARALALAGRDVVLLERFRLGHARGSSHGTTRVLRVSHPDPAWVRLAQETLPAWRELETETGTALFEQTGSLDVGGDLEPHERALAACAADFDLVDPAEAEARFGVALPPRARVLFQPEGGILRAEDAQRVAVESAMSAGVRVREETEAVALEAGDAGVRVSTSAGALEARAAVVTAGAWAARLLRTAGIDLPAQATRETVAYFRRPGAWTRPPVLDFSVPGPGGGELERPGTHVYSVASSVDAIKVGLHRSGPPTDPDDAPGPDGRVVDWLARWAERRLDVGTARLVGAETCIYTNLSDDRFLLERRGRVVVGSPCSGHGFKFAPAVAERLARLAAEAADGTGAAYSSLEVAPESGAKKPAKPG